MRPFGHRRTKVKEFLKQRKSKRRFIALGVKHERNTITGYRINKNGKVIL